MPSKIFLTACLILLVLPFLLIAEEDQFTVAPVYVQDYIQNEEGTEYRFHSAGLNVSFIREGKLNLIFDFTAAAPILLTEDGDQSLSYDYYSYPGSFSLLAGPVWQIPLGENFILEPALGLQGGIINLKGAVSGFAICSFGNCNQYSP